ncbi:MAG: hypothetical protein LYZ69_08495 [Nitrososphaerales archaeon]|nr:hypothetical protein [Nitrososphaerales archaeon]
MAEPSRRALELNELTWWSGWASLTWLDRNTYVFTSSEFNEPFFNRAGFLECRGIRRSLAEVERRFQSVRVDPTVLAYDSCASATAALTDSGYTLVDKMAVLRLITPKFRTNGALRVESVKSGSREGWSRAYLLSFYGGTGLLSAVSRVVSRLLRKRGVTLLEGRIGGEVAGVLAIQRSSQLAGVYCVGTIPRFRKTGVSGTLISEAYRIASAGRRRLILQTLESDGAEGFYVAGGFKRLYAKNVMARKLKS